MIKNILVLCTGNSCRTGQSSIRGQITKETVVAHKTGQSATNENGITAAVNDVGIVFLPNGGYFYPSVFVSESGESMEANNKIISNVAKEVWEHFKKAAISLNAKSPAA